MDTETQPPPEVLARIEAFLPKGLTEPTLSEVTSFTRSSVLASRPNTVNMAAQRLTTLAGLTRWCVEVGIPVTIPTVLHPDTVDRYIETAMREKKGAHTTRTMLRSVGRTLVPRLYPAQAREIPRPRRLSGYSDEEISRFLQLAAHQSTRRLQDRLTAIVALGAGAGLRAREIRLVSASDLQPTSRGLMVVVRDRRFPRTILIRRRFADTLVDVYSRYPDRPLFPGGERVPSNAIRDLSGGRDLPRLEFIRLRATWITAMQRGMGVAAFLYAAGVTYPRDFIDYIRDDPLPSIDQVADVLGRADS